MKKLLTKIKAILTVLWVTLIFFSSKVMGFVMKTDDLFDENGNWKFKTNQTYSIQQTVYWVPNTISPISPALNAVQRLTSIAIFIIWIVNFIRIMRTNDEDLKKKRIKNTIIVITILVIILVATLIISTLLLGK